MFGIIADLIASAITILLPCFISYKALRTGDPAQINPWLVYFLILVLFLLFESWTLFIIGWIPGYAWLRLFFLLYLVLPQTQGAKHLYIEYFEPYILHHEKQIDDFISQTHTRLEQMGLGYMNVVVEWIREKILGQTSPQAANVIPPGAQGYAGYASELLSRFAMPAARTQAAPAVAAGPTGVLNMLSSAAGAAFSVGGAAMGTGSARSMPASAQAASIPDSHLSGMANMSTEQKQSYINTQRDRLTAILKDLDKEQQSLHLAYGDTKTATSSSSRRPPSSSSHGGEFTKSRSQMSFDNIDYEDIHSASGSGSGYPSQHSTPPMMRQTAGQGQRSTSGGWVTGSIGGWLGGSPRDESHRDREERHGPRVGDRTPEDDDYLNRGYSTARDAINSVARNIKESGRERDRYDR